MEQIFLLEEHEDTTFDLKNNEEWRNQIEDLNLEGQKKLVEGDVASPVPFQHMNNSLKRVLEELCPTKVDVTEYSIGPIPLKVLAAVALCEKENYFRAIKVWYDDKSPDPVLVGYCGEDDYSGERYLIARWGDMMRSFEELREMAEKRWVKTTRAKLQEAKAKLEIQINSVESLAVQHFNGDWVLLVS